MTQVGNHYRAEDYYEVGREKVREYARAVLDYHPAHWHENHVREMGYDGLLAPLTFTAVITELGRRRLFDADYPSRLSETGHHFRFHRPIVVGDRLSCDLYLHPPGGDRLTAAAVLTDHIGEPVVTCCIGLVARGDTAVTADATVRDAVRRARMHGLGRGDVPAAAPRPPAAGRAGRDAADRGRNAPHFAEVAAGDRLPPRTHTLTLGDLVNYAGAAGDPNPIHWSPDIATLLGAPSGVVAHPMLTTALGTGLVTAWAGDPGAVLDYRMRLLGPVFVTAETPAEVEYAGTVTSLDASSRTAVVDITAAQRGGTPFGRAAATVRLR